MAEDLAVLDLRFRYVEREPQSVEIVWLIAALESAYRHAYWWTEEEIREPPMFYGLVLYPEHWPHPPLKEVDPSAALRVRRLSLGSPLDIVLSIPLEYYAAVAVPFGHRLVAAFVSTVEFVFTAPERIRAKKAAYRADEKRHEAEVKKAEVDIKRFEVEKQRYEAELRQLEVPTEDAWEASGRQKPFELERGTVSLEGHEER
jgi:hypothetical protein